MSVSRCCQRSRKLCQCHNGANLHQRYWDNRRGSQEPLSEQPARTGVPAVGDGGWYFVTFDPAIIDNEPDKQQLIDLDLSLAVRFLKTKSLEPPVGEYRWVGGFSEIIDAINCRWKETSKPVEVSLDTESMGLYPWYKDKHIVSIGFTCEAGRADCLYLGPFRDPVAPSTPSCSTRSSGS